VVVAPVVVAPVVVAPVVVAPVEHKEYTQAYKQAKYDEMLQTMMEIIEKTQTPEGVNEGDYLVACNSLLKLKKLQEQLKGNTIFIELNREREERVARLKKGKVEMWKQFKKELVKKVACDRCGSLFTDRNGMINHQNTTIKCKSIVAEKCEAIATRKATRDEKSTHKNANLIAVKFWGNDFSRVLKDMSATHQIHKEEVKKKKDEKTELIWERKKGKLRQNEKRWNVRID
jgi:hypothetical protein